MKLNFLNLVDFVKKLLDNKIYVIVAGLNGDSIKKNLDIYWI